MNKGNWRNLFAAAGLLVLAGCGQPDIDGRWSGTYMSEDSQLGDTKMEFVLYIRPDNRYSITTRGTFLAVDMTKILDKETGLWVEKRGNLSLTPQICHSIDEDYVLVETECQPPREIEIKIKDGKWQIPTAEGKAVELSREGS